MKFGQGFPCFWAVAPVRAFAEGGVGWFGLGFVHGRIHGNLRGGLEDPFLSGPSHHEGTETLFWNLGRIYLVLGHFYRGDSLGG